MLGLLEDFLIDGPSCTTACATDSSTDGDERQGQSQPNLLIPEKLGFGGFRGFGNSRRSAHGASVRVVPPNDSDQRLATAGLAIPLDAIASPLHRLVRRNPGHLLRK